MSLETQASLAVLLRGGLYTFSQCSHLLEARPEINTPQTAWSRVEEGLSLSAISNQDGSYHGSTLLLIFARAITHLHPLLQQLLFIVCDLVTAFALMKFVKQFLKNEIESQESTESLACGIESIKLKKESLHYIPHMVFSLYLFNPMMVATCVSKTTIIFNNLFTSLFLLEAISGNLVTMTFFLALTTYETMYPLQLITVACLCYWKYKRQSYLLRSCVVVLRAGQSTESTLQSCVGRVTMCFVMWLGLLFATAYLYNASLPATVAHYRFILKVPDQTPNVGVFWYFFTEIFDHFELFFLCVFQLNLIFYSIPLSIKFSRHPVMLGFILIALMAIYKPYPSLGDAAVWLALVPMWSHVFKYLRLNAISLIAIFATALLCPVMWNMWIRANAANANFFFAATCAYALAQILLVCDVSLAYVKWHFHLSNGLHLTDHGKPQLLRLVN